MPEKGEVAVATSSTTQNKDVKAACVGDARIDSLLEILKQTAEED